MTHEPQPITDAQVDDYLDGLMKPEKREAFEIQLRAHPEVAKEIHLQAQIDDSLARLFPEQQASERQLAELQLSSSPAFPAPDLRLMIGAELYDSPD